jgi:O-antigen ligase/tetratricopeptide (TPR) repeat protein
MPNINKSLNILWVGVFLLILAISAPWFNLYISNHDLVKSYTASFGVSLLMLAALYFKCLESDTNIKINYVKLTLFLLFLFGTLSLLWSVNIDFAIGKWLLWIITLFSFILSLNLSLTHNNLIKLAWGLVLAAGLIAIIGVLQRFSYPFSLTEAAWPASTFGNKNMAAQAIVLIFPLFIFLLFSELVQGIKVWVLLVLTSLTFTYIIFTESRAAWISISLELLMIFFYFIIIRLKKRQWVSWNSNKTLACIFILLITALLLNISPNGEFQNTLIDVSEIITSTGTQSDGASIQRFQIWNTAIEMFSDSKFIGTGLGSYAQNLANEGYATWTINNTMRVHNDMIELAVELGLIGIVIFAAVVIAITTGTLTILKQTSGEIHFFFLIIFISLTGSFLNLQFSFPYQMAFPLLLFGLYSGLIAQYIDRFNTPIKSFRLSIQAKYKKIILIVATFLILLIFHFTYFQWINAYEKFDKIILSGDYSQLEILDTPVYDQKSQFFLYSLGGKYFNKGNYTTSKLFDKKFLDIWPNHLDVLYRATYAEHMTKNNPVALQMVKKLKKIEPKGLYNSYIVEMFIYLNENKINKLEETFQELLLKPEELLELNDDTYRFMVFFTLASENLSKYAKNLYEKYVIQHGYSCEIENNIAIHYFNKEDFNMASIHVNKTIDKDQNCLNPELVRLLAEKGLLIE